MPPAPRGAGRKAAGARPGTRARRRRQLQIRQGFRGCAFLNAASEFEDPQSPVRQVVAEHRQWYYQLLRRAFQDAGHELPANAARHFVMLRDGAMSAAYLDTPRRRERTFTRGVDGLLKSMDIASMADPDDTDEA